MPPETRGFYLHPEMDFRHVREQGRIIIRSADGSTVYDDAGTAYLDAQAGLCLVNIGYGRRELAQVAARQMETLPYYHTYWRFAHEPALRLTERLAELAPEGLTAVFLSPGGAEAVEAAIKLARAYHRARGQAGRYKVICLQNAYHGNTFGALAATGLAPHREMFEPLPPGFVHVPPPDLLWGPYTYGDSQAGEKYAAFIEEAIRAEGPETVAAVLAEPVPAVGGVTVPPPDYWPRVRAICDRYGVLLIADEVLTGWGRCGHLWAMPGLYGVTPDILVTAKGITSGYLPLGATLAHRRIAGALEGLGSFPHGHTYSGHPVACAVALAAVDILLREELPERARALGADLMHRLRAQNNPAYADVRGHGLLVGIALGHPRTGEPWPQEAVFRVEAECFRQGVIIGVCPYHPVIMLTPPLIITPAEVARLAAAVDRAVRTVAADL